MLQPIKEKIMTHETIVRDYVICRDAMLEELHSYHALIKHELKNLPTIENIPTHGVQERARVEASIDFLWTRIDAIESQIATTKKSLVQRLFDEGRIKDYLIRD
jgi:predicted HAD superfamily Cof-like phosphohydrolase